MRAVLQRVTAARVTVDKTIVGSIGPGILLYLGIHPTDTDEDAEWLIKKATSLRIFEDESGRMNRSIIESDGAILVISQFTLFGTVKKGTRPSFSRAARPETALAQYNAFLEKLEQAIGKPIQSGCFGATMAVESTNDGPVTLILDTHDKGF